MAEQEYVVVYAATCPTVAAARGVLDAIEHLHKELAGAYDAAVVDKENGKAHVVKRMDHPHVRIIPEWFGGGVLTRKELNEAAEELLADEAGLIVVGEATIEPALDKALTGTAKVFKREVAAASCKKRSKADRPRTRRSRSSGSLLPGLSRPLPDNTTGIATWLDAREPSRRGDLIRERSVVQSPPRPRSSPST